MGTKNGMSASPMPFARPVLEVGRRKEIPMGYGMEIRLYTGLAIKMSVVARVCKAAWDWSRSST